jgi:hypothetical protein
MPSILTRTQSRPLRQTLLFWLLVLGIMIVGVLWLEGYVRDQFVSALQISGQVDRGRRGWTDDQVESLLNDTLLVFGSLVILLAPMALALAIGETRPGGAGWKLLTFICCTVAAWFLFFAETSGLVIAFVAWLLAWASAMAMRMSFSRRAT